MFDFRFPDFKLPEFDLPEFDATDFTPDYAAINETSDRVLDAVVDSNRRVVEFAVTTADKLAEQLPGELPFADRFPTPTESGDRYLDFVERAVAINRDLNQRVVELLTSATPGVDAPVADESADASATKPAGAKNTGSKPGSKKAGSKKTGSKSSTRTSAKTTAGRAKKSA